MPVCPGRLCTICFELSKHAPGGTATLQAYVCNLQCNTADAPHTVWGGCTGMWEGRACLCGTVAAGGSALPYSRRTPTGHQYIPSFVC